MRQTAAPLPPAVPPAATLALLLGCGGLWHTLYLQFRHLLPFLACHLLTFLAAPLQRKDEAEAKTFDNLCNAIETVNRIFHGRNQSVGPVDAAPQDSRRLLLPLDLTGTIRFSLPSHLAGLPAYAKSLSPEARRSFRRLAIDAKYRVSKVMSEVRPALRGSCRASLGFIRACLNNGCRLLQSGARLHPASPRCLWHPPPP